MDIWVAGCSRSFAWTRDLAIGVKRHGEQALSPVASVQNNQLSVVHALKAQWVNFYLGLEAQPLTRSGTWSSASIRLCAIDRRHRHAQAPNIPLPLQGRGVTNPPRRAYAVQIA